MSKYSTKNKENKKTRHDLQMFCPACFHVGLKTIEEPGIVPEYIEQKYTIKQLEAHLFNKHSLEELMGATLDFALYHLEGGAKREVI